MKLKAVELFFETSDFSFEFYLNSLILLLDLLDLVFEFLIFGFLVSDDIV
jgi:hypothetical protein